MDTFQIYDDLIYSLYEETDINSVKQILMNGLRQLAPFQYASMFLVNSGNGSAFGITNILGEPNSFTAVEKKNIEWNKLEWKRRLEMASGSEVIHCSHAHEAYGAPNASTYHFNDTVHLLIRHETITLAVITLYRTSEEEFSESEIMLLNRLCRHLSNVFFKFADAPSSASSVDESIETITRRVHMTPKEKQILRLIFLAKSNYEICDELNIKEHTLQKHYQNIYRKLNISSKWELMRFSVGTVSA